MPTMPAELPQPVELQVLQSAELQVLQSVQLELSELQSELRSELQPEQLLSSAPEVEGSATAAPPRNRPLHASLQSGSADAFAFRRSPISTGAVRDARLEIHARRVACALRRSVPPARYRPAWRRRCRART